MHERIDEKYQDKLDDVRWELRAYNRDTDETLARVTDYDQEVVLDKALSIKHKVEDMILQEATEDIYDVEPAEY